MQALDITCFSDSASAGDPISRWNVSGFILYVPCVLVLWQSKAQRSVTLVSSEAEWVAFLKVVEEVMIVIQLL